MTSVSTRGRITNQARKLFFEHGFRTVTMDEVAASLQMSKRTLYRHFPSKKSLLRASLEEKLEEVAAGLQERVERPSDLYPEKLLAVIQYMRSALPRPSDRFLRDVRQHAPEVWQPLDQRRAQVLRHQFGRLLEEGRRQGLICDTLAPELVLMVFIQIIRAVISPEALTALPLTASQAFQQICDLLFQGVLTPAGQESYRRLASSRGTGP